MRKEEKMGLFGRKKNKKKIVPEPPRLVNVGLRHVDDLTQGNVNQTKKIIPSWEQSKENISEKEQKLKELMKKREFLVNELKNKDKSSNIPKPPINLPQKTQIENLNQSNNTFNPHENVVPKIEDKQENKIVNVPEKNISHNNLQNSISENLSDEIPNEIPSLDESLSDELYDLGDIGMEDVEQITKEAKTNMEEKGDKFIDINTYKEIIFGIKEIKNDADDSENFLERMNKIKDVTDSSIITISNTIEDIERKLLYIDKEIFEE